MTTGLKQHSLPFKVYPKLQASQIFAEDRQVWQFSVVQSRMKFVLVLSVTFEFTYVIVALDVIDALDVLDVIDAFVVLDAIDEFDIMDGLGATELF